MKYHPIIMSTEMVRAILEGRKTQTRRVIKPQPHGDVWFSKTDFHICTMPKTCSLILSHCPYGQVGDRIWVRESHKLTRFELNGGDWVKCEYRSDYDNDGGIRYFRWLDIPIKQRARLSKIRTWGKWRPARFMYLFLARITLEITGVRVERLQEISWRDCQREGAVTEKMPFSVYTEPWKDAFERLWDSLNAKRGYSWETNPWVWVICFKELPD